RSSDLDFKDILHGDRKTYAKDIFDTADLSAQPIEGREIFFEMAGTQYIDHHDEKHQCTVDQGCDPYPANPHRFEAKHTFDQDNGYDHIEDIAPYRDLHGLSGKT